MLYLVIEMFSYPFMVRALLVGALIALCAAMLGVTLVLKRYSMIGDGLSHVGFGALAIASAMNAAPLLVAIRRAGSGRHRCLHDHRHEHRRLQLSVRKYPEYVGK